jgi:NAD(P)H-hydrate epimerase
MLTRRDVAVLDANSEYLGVPVETLMENAGYAVANVAEKEFGTGKRVAVICGNGNNGGDGFVAARYLREKNDVDVILARSADAIRGQASWGNYERVQEISKPWRGQDLVTYDLIIDALLGTGTTGDLREPFTEIVKAINASKVYVLSVDVPSGLGTNVVVRPMFTITFHDVKEGMTEKNSGKMIVSDIGIPEEALTHCGPGDYAYYPIPSESSHKGDNGRALIVGGGPYTGAPFLAAMAAYRIGADLVYISAPASASQTIASFSPNVIVRPLLGSIVNTSDLPRLKAHTREMDAVLLGPGLGRDPQTFEAIREYVKTCDVPLVIDADGFAALSGYLDALKGKKGILTPHGGEFQKLTGEPVAGDIEGRKAQTKALAAKTGMTVILKGAVDIVSDGREVRLNRTGNPGMSVGGTGDILAGICVGLLAKGAEPFQAARMAAFTCGSAGDMAFSKHSYGLVATDLFDTIPLVLRHSLDSFI